MKKLLIILFSLLLMPACVHRPTVVVRSLLEEAEGMMHTCPDTAYFLLQEMGATMDLGTKADSAYQPEFGIRNNVLKVVILIIFSTFMVEKQKLIKL